MSETIKDGGPAFLCGSGDMRDPSGMTLRDYFAARAIGEAAALEIEYPTGPNGKTSYAGAAQRAYLMADAMLRARESQP